MTGECPTCKGRGKVSCVSNPELCSHGPYMDGEPCHYGSLKTCPSCGGQGFIGIFDLCPGGQHA